MDENMKESLERELGAHTDCVKALVELDDPGSQAAVLGSVARFLELDVEPSAGGIIEMVTNAVGSTLGGGQKAASRDPMAWKPGDPAPTPAGGLGDFGAAASQLLACFPPEMWPKISDTLEQLCKEAGEQNPAKDIPDEG